MNPDREEELVAKLRFVMPRPKLRFANVSFRFAVSQFRERRHAPPFAKQSFARCDTERSSVSSEASRSNLTSVW